MNCYEIGEGAKTVNGYVLEVKTAGEIYGFLDPSDSTMTIMGEMFTMDVPDGYTVEVHNWDPLVNDYSNAVETIQTNFKYTTREYSGKTYNSYVLSSISDPYDGPFNVNPTRYKIIIKKTTN